MKAITVRQPWATAIVRMGKDVENRSRNRATRPLEPPRRRPRRCRMTVNRTGLLAWALLTTGFLIGTTSPPLNGRTVLALALITLGGALLLTVAGRHHQGPRT